MEKAYSLSADHVALNLQCDTKKGLTSSEVQLRFEKFGPNALKGTKEKNPLGLFLSQFKSFLIVILLLASILSYFLGESTNALMIMIVVILNAVIGFIQEYRVEKAIQDLKKLVTLSVVVIRDGQMTQIPSTQLVPGDLILLEEGQKVPADIRLISVINLQTIEAALTGESTPVVKNTRTLPSPLPVADQVNMVFAGTVISAGKGRGIVTTTGMDTEIGKIAHLVSSQQPPKTPMQIKLDKLGQSIGKLILVISLIVGAEEMAFHQEKIINALIFAVALAVAAIPEGLPAVITISLALGTRKLLKQNALLRNLPSAETLGSTDVICTDKTGTLTEGVMNVRQIYIDDQILNMNGDNIKEPSFRQKLQKILQVGVLSSNARKSINPNTSAVEVIGDTTEAALIRVAEETGLDSTQINNNFQRLSEIPFTSHRKMMTVTVLNQDQELVISKGAAETVLEKCTRIEKNGRVELLTEEERSQILKVNNKMADNALRVLAFAYKEVKGSSQDYLTSTGSDFEPHKKSDKELESDLVFLGLQGMMDPPRKGVKDTIEVCKKAGIRVVMITGDHLLTAKAVARELGIEGESITGIELDSLAEDQFNQRVERISVYARVNPEHKIRIIKALKAYGHQVAMTGDGINDAPALKASDIGLAMGITGTDVAKDSSDMILLDDNFNTIVAAIGEGRGIYDNVRKFVAYMLSTNTMEVLVIFLAVIIGWPLPLLPIHILWINLVSDSLPAIAIGVDPVSPNVMTSSPSQFREDILNKKFVKILVLVSGLVTAAVLSMFAFAKADLIHAQSIAFTAIVIYEMLVVVAIRSRYSLSFFSNKFLVAAMASSIILQLMVLYLPLSIGHTSIQNLFRVQPLNVVDWAVVSILGILIFIIMRLLILVPEKNKPVQTSPNYLPKPLLQSASE